MNYYPEIFNSIQSLPYLLTLTVLLRYLIFPAFKLQFLRYKGITTHFYPPIVSQRHWNSSIKTKAGRHQRLMFPNQKALAANCGRNIIFVLYDCEYKNLFLQSQHFYKKTDSIDFIKPLVNSGLLLQSNKFQIKTLSFDLNINFLHATIQQLLHKIPESAYKKFPLMKTIEEIIGQIIGLVYFGENLHNYTFEGKPVTFALTEIAKQISNSSTRPIGQLLGDRITTKMPHYRTLKRKVQSLRQLCLKILQEKTVQPQQKSEEKETPAASLNNNEEILNQFMGFFIDAISTTKHLVCISLYNVLQHSECLEILTTEREAVYRNPEGQVSLETVKKMEALQAFFQETLRFYPAAPNILARVAVKNHKLADLAIKKGDQVRVDMLASFFDEKFFEDPLRFDLERWRRTKQKLDPFMLTPFLGGNKSISGQNMVIITSKILVSEFLEKFKFDLAECKNLGKIANSPHEHLNDIFFNISRTQGKESF